MLSMEVLFTRIVYTNPTFVQHFLCIDFLSTNFFLFLFCIQYLRLKNERFLADIKRVKNLSMRLKGSNDCRRKRFVVSRYLYTI